MNKQIVVIGSLNMDMGALSPCISWHDEITHLVPAFAVEAVHTTAVGVLTATGPGAQPSLPERAAVESLLSSHNIIDD